MKQLTMEDILNSDFGSDYEGDIRVIFQKKTAIKQYEPELIEVEMTLRDLKGMNGADRMLSAGTLLAQAEYVGLVQLLAKRHINQDEFQKRKQSLVDGMQALVDKYIALTGEEPTKFFKWELSKEDLYALYLKQHKYNAYILDIYKKYL